MSEPTAVFQIDTENKSFLKLSPGNLFKKASKYGMAASMLGSSYLPTAYVAYSSDPPLIAQNFNVSSGLSSAKLSKSIENEKELNQFSFKGFNFSSTEYVKSNYITLNGSLLEANYEMGKNTDNYETLYNEDMVSDFSFEPKAKKTFKLHGELSIIKNAQSDHQYFVHDFLQDEVSFEPTPKRTFKL